MFLSYNDQNRLVNAGLARRSDNGNLSTFKYARKVMYDYLWDRYPELTECRGHTYDRTTSKLVVAAPRKTFNYLENNTWSEYMLDTPVLAYKKYNGFMACVVKYGEENVVSTTGSTKSQHVDWAKAVLPSHVFNNQTSVYEIILPQDPHIVDEGVVGSVYLGTRNSKTGDFWPSGGTRNMQIKTLSDAIEFCRTDKGEGFMLYDYNGNCCKIKTQYYVGKKKLMRMSASNVKQTWQNPELVQSSLPYYWNGVVQYILSTQQQEQWIQMADQERRKELEKFA